MKTFTDESNIEIYGHEYNAGVVGYIIKTSEGDLTAQFEKCNSNHPEPAYRLFIGCEGDNTSDHLSDKAKAVVGKYIDNCKEMDELEKAFTKAMYNDSALKNRTSPIYKYEIEEYAEYEEDNAE